MQGLIEFCPGLKRLVYILGWLYEIILDQVNPYSSRLFAPPSLWPGWEWGQINAYQSHRERPWEPYRYRGTVDIDDDEF